MNSTLPVIVIVVIAVAAASWYVSQGFKPARMTSATEKYIDSALAACKRSDSIEYRNCKLGLLCSEKAANKTQTCEYLNLTASICGNLATACAQPQKAAADCRGDPYCYHSVMSMVSDRDVNTAITICNTEQDAMSRDICYSDAMAAALRTGQLAESCKIITNQAYQTTCLKLAKG